MSIRDVCTAANAGSMCKLNVELEFRPATGIVTITLPYLPVFKPRAPEMVNFQCEMPSHPGVGGIKTGVVEVDWVYNPNPPAAGRYIHPLS